MKARLPTTDYSSYTTTWNQVATEGMRELNLDAWASGRRYLSLTTIELTPNEARQLRTVTRTFARLLDRAVDGILQDPDWWSALAWPWPAIELARQEPPHPENQASLYGRFDCLLDRHGNWQIIEYNADTPSGGREISGLEPAIARLHPDLRRLESGFTNRLCATIAKRILEYQQPVHLVGVVSAHSWLEDMAQATWLSWRLQRTGIPALVGDVTDLATRGSKITLRGQPIDALYRFYPVERLYRHAIFASLHEAAIAEQLLVLNGLRAFLAQSKACLAWLWTHRLDFSAEDCAAIERHLPATLLARDPAALDLLADSVVKHVNGREGDSVVFGRTLRPSDPAWEARLLEGGYVVQQLVDSPVVADVEVDDVQRCVTIVEPRFACVGGFAADGEFAGCYTRLDGPITTARATYVATLRQPFSTSAELPR